MRCFRPFFLGLSFTLLAAALPGQTTVPAVGRSLPALSVAPAGVTATFDLRDYFMLPGVSGTIVQFDTVLGKFNIEMLSSDAPLTVANFLNYVNRGAYTNNVIHRSAWNFPQGAPSFPFVLQGGGFQLSGNSIINVPADPPVVNEFKLSNLRGTVSLAKTSQGPNSATNQWFFNMGDNSANLDNQNGGFTVFARVLGTGMSVVDTISALPRYNASGNLGGDFTEMPLRGPDLTAANLALVRTVTTVPTFPTSQGAAAAVSFSAQTSNSGVATVTVNGSTLTVLTGDAGTTTITVSGTDTNGNRADAAFAVVVSPGPTFVAQPESRTVNAGDTVVLNAVASGTPSYQWQRNGVDVAGATGATLTLNNVQPANAGIYVARASDGSATRASEPAVVALGSSAKVIGAASEVGPDIMHANGNVYDQILLTGAAATFRADPDQIVRLSYIDENDDIVQVEFTGAGAVSISLENASGPATPLKYNQPTVSYMKGRATIVLGGTDASSNLTIFSVGRATAVNPALFPAGVSYDGMADLATVAISPTSGVFNGLRAANVRFSAATGLVGIYAPRVILNNVLFVGGINASGNAVPTIVTASAGDVRVTGGDLQQANGQAVRVDGMTRVQMAAGSDSHGNLQSQQPIRGRLERSGVDVTDQMVN